MVKIISKISSAMKAIRMVAAFGSCIAAASTAWCMEWEKHFPETDVKSVEDVK